MWVPLESVDGRIHVIMDDPKNILKRDTIESILKTKAVKYDVALPEDIIKFINLFYSTTEDDPVDNGHSGTDLFQTKKLKRMKAKLSQNLTASSCRL